MRRLRSGIAAIALGLSTACGGGPAAAPTPDTIVQPTSVPAPAKPSVSAVASPSPVAVPSATATAAPAAATADTVYVGNTDGVGVFVRKTPVMADRLRAYPDGTALAIIGDDVDGDGQHWRHVRTPDGLEGYV